MDLKTIYDAVVDGDQKAVEDGVRAALAEGVTPGEILEKGLIAPMKAVGWRFECGESFVPEMLIAAQAMKAGLAVLKPQLAAAHIEPRGKVVIGTVQGDIHDIGKNLVGMMLQGSGFEVVDLGVNTTPGKFVDAVRLHQPELLGLSALLTTTMPRMKEVMRALEEAGVRDRVKVMVGGAPVTEEYAREVGADLFAPDAATAAALARDLVTV